jgi:hypothetical protein
MFEIKADLNSPLWLSRMPHPLYACLISLVCHKPCNWISYALHSQHQIKGRHLEKDIFYLLRIKRVTSGISHVTTRYHYQLRHCILLMCYKFPNGIFIVWCFIKHIVVYVFCCLVRCNTCVMFNDCHII